jgi:hypothetical protein
MMELMPIYDYTVAMDNWLTQRVSRCMLCGCLLEFRQTSWWTTYGVSLLVVRCLRCRTDDVRMQELLEMRYRPDRFRPEDAA